MSKLHLIEEIQTVVKMATKDSIDNTKLTLYLDDLLSNYAIEQRDQLDMILAGENYIRMYLDALRVESYSPLTIQNYGYQLAEFVQYMDGKSLIKATTADVRNYLASFKHLKQSTVATKLTRISAFFEWLVSEDELIKNPCAKIRSIKTPSKVRDGLTIIELEQVRAACLTPKRKNQNCYEQDRARKRALIEVLYSTACRLDELYKLNIHDVDWQTGAVIVCGKGNKERRVYLSEKAMLYYRAYLEVRTDNCEALFVTIRKPIRRMKHAAIQGVIKSIAKDAGINRPLHPHIFRHTFAQLSLNAGMPLEDLQSYLGHQSPNTTMRYAAISENRKHEAFKRYHVQ